MATCFFHNADFAQRDQKLFEIVEAAYQQHDKILIFSDSRERAVIIDRFLWSLKQDSFIPHKIFSDPGPEENVPVGIVIQEINPIGASILIADGHCGFDFAAAFKTVHEFVDRSTPERHEACRRRFKAYRDMQFAVEYLK